jgi:hypothetical protein
VLVDDEVVLDKVVVVETHRYRKKNNKKST